MSSSRQLFFAEDNPGERLDSFIAASLPDISRSQIKKLIDSQAITIAGAAVKASHKLRGGETIFIELPDPEPTEAIPENIPLAVLYEDSDVIVVDKAAGMVVHPAAGHASGTLVNALLYHCEDLAGIGGALRPGIVHRIDKDTSGVMIATKNDQSHIHLAQQFKDHSINRVYVALVHGIPKTARGTIDLPIGRHPVQRKKMSSQGRQTKHAVTHWSVLKKYPEAQLSLVEFKLETGRTHQIRVHFSEQGHPLVADPLYGRPISSFKRDPQLISLVKTLPGQALHAKTLGFIHPKTEEYLEFSSEIPEILGKIITYLDLQNQAA